MKTKSVPNGISLYGYKCFDLALTLDCGQAFRWKQTEDGWHGVVKGKAIDIVQSDNQILFKNITQSEFDKLWFDYFDLSRSYSEVCNTLSKDLHLKTAVEGCYGIRLLRQDTWEALVSFIISQNNNIPRIKGIVDRLCTSFGDKITNDNIANDNIANDKITSDKIASDNITNDKIVQNDFTFPTPERIANLSLEDLSPLRAGFRAGYILDAAQKVTNGEVRLDILPSIPLDEAREELKKIRGVGPKVAECTLLYGCGRVDAFPVDVWVKRLMGELYPDGLPEYTKGVEGIAQQYLFHWRRNQPK